MRSERKSNEEIDRSVRDMIDSYGEPLPISTRDWIYATYDFINAVLSGYYDVESMRLDIVNGILSATRDESFENEYVRNINAGGLE